MLINKQIDVGSRKEIFLQIAVAASSADAAATAAGFRVFRAEPHIFSSDGTGCVFLVFAMWAALDWAPPVIVVRVVIVPPVVVKRGLSFWRPFPLF